MNYIETARGYGKPRGDGEVGVVSVPGMTAYGEVEHPRCTRATNLCVLTSVPG